MAFRKLNAEDRKLIEAAREAIKRGYLKHYHTVGSAVLCPSGKVYVGVNVEACGYGPCAEPVAIGAAFTAGERGISKIVAVKKRGSRYPVLSPCGNCRQLVFDYSPNAEVIASIGGRVVKVRAKDLLPGAYESNFEN